jgi:hypothetical protein
MNLTRLLTSPHKKDLNKDSIEETISVGARKKERKYTGIEDKKDFSRTSLNLGQLWTTLHTKPF